jgi:hypothetical protein
MEVHHHPHVGKKNFKEYFLEYVMIVLAVTTGFFAESLREYIGDSEKEEAYIKSLKADLLIDTANLSKSIYWQTIQIEIFDSLRVLLNKPVLDSSEINMAYYCARISTKKSPFKPNDKTVVQLKNSGNFRLIKNTAIINKLIQYQKKIEDYEYNSGFDRNEAEQLYPFIAKIFDPNVFETMFQGEVFSGPASVVKPKGLNKLNIENKELTKQFIYYLHQRKTSFKTELNTLKEMKAISTAMVELINNEYHLKK